ncbi:hypothetical protein UlMin_039361 [Ulmus minor]
MSTSSQTSLPTSETMEDIFLWRKKKQSILVLLLSTATWVLLEVYQFNFLTVLSWIAMFIVVSTFLLGNLLRLLGKEPPNLSGLELTEESALQLAVLVHTWIEEGFKWMFRVSAEGDCFTFAFTVGGLWLLSQIGKKLDLLTFLYTGIVMGMTVPVIYVNYEDDIKRCKERIKEQLKRYYEMLDEKVMKKMMGKVVKNKEEKERISKMANDAEEQEKINKEEKVE